MNDKINKYYTIILTLLCLLIFSVNSYSQYIFDKNKLPDEVSLHNYSSLVDVGNNKLDIQYVLANFDSLHPQRLKTKNQYIGFKRTNFWVEVALENPTDLNLKYFLQTARPTTNLVELFIVDVVSGKIERKTSGVLRNYYAQSFASHKTIFVLDIKPRSKLKLVMHLKNDGQALILPIIIDSPEKFITKELKEQLLNGVIYGILFFVIVLYFFFYFATRRKAFLYYCLFVGFAGLYQFTVDGFFNHIVIPYGVWITYHPILAFSLISFIFAGLYSEEFLEIKKHCKTLHNFYKVVYVLCFCLLSLSFGIPSFLYVYYPLGLLLGLTLFGLNLWSIACLKFKNIRVDLFFSIGVSIVFFAFGIQAMYYFGLIPCSYAIKNSYKIGTIFEVIFLSISLANYIRNLKNKKNIMMRLSLEKAEEMNEMKTNFLSNISHELRTPLNSIINLAELIWADIKDPEIKMKCEIIKHSSYSLLSSVNDILDFSKIEKGELTLENSSFDPSIVFETLNNSSAIKAKDQGLAFQFSKSGRLPHFLIGDVARLIHILDIILNNAFKYTFEGGVKFNLDVVAKSEHKVGLIMTISDSGVGIPDKNLKNIFDSFNQIDSSNKRKFSGLGLGLYIVKKIVDLQNGTLEMDSSLNKGTSVKITLEYEIDEVSQDEKKEDEIVPLFYDLNGKSVLVVEDNAINQMVIKVIMKKWLNTNIVFSNNGKEALDALKTNHFDIVLMDLQMPVMDGYEATIAIRNGEAGLNNTKVPILAVTADVTEATKQRVKEIGMNDYLSKPIKKETLFQAINKLVN